MKKSHLLAKTVLLAWLSVLTTQAVQAAVVPLNEIRSVHANASVVAQTGIDNVDTMRNSLGDFSDFNELVGADLTIEGASASSSAMQISSFADTALSASGVATASAVTSDSFFEFAASSADTGLFVNFELTTAQLFNLSGAVSVTSPLQFSGGMADFSLRNQDGSVNINFSTFENLTILFNESGTLFPGIYTLGASAMTFGDGIMASTTTAEFSFDINIAPIPIPPALWLFGSGLLGLVGMARRKKAA